MLNSLLELSNSLLYPNYFSLSHSRIAYFSISLSGKKTEILVGYDSPCYEKYFSHTYRKFSKSRCHENYTFSDKTYENDIFAPNLIYSKALYTQNLQLQVCHYPFLVRLRQSDRLRHSNRVLYLNRVRHSNHARRDLGSQRPHPKRVSSNYCPVLELGPVYPKLTILGVTLSLLVRLRQSDCVRHSNRVRQTQCAAANPCTPKTYNLRWDIILFWLG